MKYRLIALIVPALLCTQVQASDEPTPSKPIKQALAKEEASAKEDAKPASKDKEADAADSKSKSGKETKESKAAAAARAKEALAADELAAKIAEKLAIIRKEKEEAAKTNPKATARSSAYAPPVRRPVIADAPKEKIMDSRGMIIGPNGTMASSKPAQWSYEGEGGPLNWGKISPANAKCDSGDRQSPIDIRDGIRVDLAPIGIDYKPAGFRVTDTGHTIQVNLGPGNYITVNGRSFELVQFHFHKPAEERVNGKGFEMVVHLVHKDADGKLAILAVMIERGKAHSLVQSVWNNLPLEKNDSMQGPAAMDLNDILPVKRDYYTFMGSLTEPPCTEGVLWLVMKEPIEVSPRAISDLQPVVSDECQTDPKNLWSPD